MRRERQFGLALLILASAVGCSESFTSAGSGGASGAATGGAAGAGGTAGAGGAAAMGGSAGAQDCSPLGAAIEQLATNQAELYSIAVDDEFVYWSARASGAIRRIPKDLSDVPATIASGQTGVAGIALDDGFVYWANRQATGGSVRRQPKAGGSEPELIADQLAGATWLALDEKHVYWTESTAGRVMRATKDGTNVAVLVASQNQPQHIVVDGDFAYWIRYVNAAAGTRQIVRLPKDGSGELVGFVGTADAPGVSRLALDAQHLYWNGSEADTGAIRRKSGGKPIELIEPGPKSFGPLALDATYAYWLAHEGADGVALARYPKAGGCIKVLATGEGRASSMVVDAQGVYWLDPSAGRVLRVALK